MSDGQHAAMGSARAEVLRQTLTAYYTQHAPADVAKVEALVARVVGGLPPETLNPNPRTTT